MHAANIAQVLQRLERTAQAMVLRRKELTRSSPRRCQRDAQISSKKLLVEMCEYIIPQCGKRA